MMNERVIVPGVYRHFKGNLYEVLTVSKHTETGDTLVTYKGLYDDHNYYSRPLDMFSSKVDYISYPECKASYRFELIKPYANSNYMDDFSLSTTMKKMKYFTKGEILQLTPTNTLSVDSNKLLTEVSPVAPRDLVKLTGREGVIKRSLTNYGDEIGLQVWRRPEELTATMISDIMEGDIYRDPTTRELVKCTCNTLVRKMVLIEDVRYEVSYVQILSSAGKAYPYSQDQVVVKTPEDAYEDYDIYR